MNFKPTTSNIIMFVVLIIVIVMTAPLLLLWSLNTLFPVLAIPYTLETWAAAILIQAVFTSLVKTKG